MQHENAFWNNVANSLNPGWSIRLNHDHPDGRPTISGHDSLVYVVDAATYWFAAGAMNELESQSAVAACKGFLATLGDTDAANQSAADIAGKVIALCGVQRFDSSAPEVALAVATTATALQETQTYRLALETNVKLGAPRLAGHWIYIAYRTKNGREIYTRPAWLSTGQHPDAPAGQFMRPETLLELVSSIVKTDTTNTGSMIYQALRQSGGAVLAPQLAL